MKKHSSLRRILAVCLSLAMVLTLVPGAARAADSNGNSVSIKELDPSEVSVDLRGDGFKAEKVDLDSDHTFKSTDRVRVMIVLPGEAAIALVDEGMDASDPAVEEYRQELLYEQEYAAGVISQDALGGKELDVVWNLTLAVNAISANVEYGQIEKIAEIPAVKAVYLERRYEPMTGGKAELNNIPAQGTTGAAALKLDGYTGAGMRIAVIDTGTAQYHQSFDAGAFEHSLSKQAEKKGMTLENYKKTLNLLTEEEIGRKMSQLNAAKAQGYDAEDAYLLYKSSKLPFGYNYIDSDTNIDHFAGYDKKGPVYEEHGSHVAGIAAANTYIPSGDGYIEAADEVGVTGVAPDAQIITMKVFGANGGAYTSDNFAAIEDAMVLDCDVVNLSLGSSGGFVTAKGEYRIIGGDTSSITEADRIDEWVDGVMDRITKDGIIMCVSAGNAGNWAEGDNYEDVIEEPYCYTTIGMGMMYTDEGGTYNVGSPSTFHNTMSVASSDNVGGVSQSKTTFAGKGGSVDLAVYSTTSEDNPDWSTMDEDAGAGTEYDVVFLGDPTSGFAAGQLQLNADKTIFGGYAVEEDESGEEILNPIGSGALTGKIVMIARGASSFYQKRDAAAEWGAVAVICYNHTPGGGVVSADLTGTESSIPFGGLSYEDGETIFDLCEKNSDGLYACKATVYGSLYVDLGEEGAMPTVSDFSSWGTTGALTIKPEITAPGGSIYSVNGGKGQAGDTDQYENMSGTSMAAPHFSGLVALTQQYIRGNSNALLKKARTAAGSSLTERQLAQSLLMSTADPLVEYTDDEGNDVLYSVRNQGAGLANVRKATSAESFIMVDGQPDGKVKAELGDGTRPWSFSFRINNLTGEALTYDLSAKMMTTGTDAYPSYGLYFSTNEMVPLEADVTFSSGTSVTVPANKSVKVTATVAVSSAAVTQMKRLGYTNGFYVEGFVYAKPVDTTGEGVQGVTHSIPMLGWYGNWTDISMFDGDAFLNYLKEEPDETRLPHVFNFYGSPILRNILLISRNGEEPGSPEDEDYTEYWYTGNVYEGAMQIGPDPDDVYVYGDEWYIPARNALNNDGNAWWQPAMFSPMLMRNAIAARVQVVDSKSGRVYDSQEYLGPFEGAYYNSSYGILIETTEYTLTPIDLDFSGIPEGTDVTINLSYAPEYYENPNGTIRWDDLGDGATMSFPFRIDNTGPELVSASIGVDEYGDPALTVTAKDENYIAFIALLDGSASGIVDLPVCPDMAEDQRGQETSTTFGLYSYLMDGNKAVVALCDYAGNERFFAINVGEVEYPGGGYGDLVGFQTGLDWSTWSEYQRWVSFSADVDEDETVMFNSRTKFCGADYVDGVVYAQDVQGWLYGIEYDDMVEGATSFESARIKRLDTAYQDMAYNYADGMLYGLYIDEDALTSYVDAIDLNNGCQVEEAVCSLEGVYCLGLACDDNGTLYVMGLDNNEGTAKLYVGSKDSAEMQALYDLNGDHAVNVLDAQDLMDYVIRGTDLENLYLADLDDDGQYTTEDVHIFLDMLDAYRPEDTYQFDELLDTEMEMDYLQSMTWDHNVETLYWARCAEGSYFPDTDLWEIDVVGKTCEQTGYLSGETCALFAPLTAANAAKDAHSNVPTTSSGSNGRPVLANAALTLAVGGSRELTYDIEPWYADNKDVTWSSSDEDVATVTRRGLVEAVGEGTCTITVANANDPTLKSTCTVNVVSLNLTISGTYSEMGGNIFSVSDSYLYTFTMDDGMQQGPQIYNPYAEYGDSFGQKMVSAVLIDGFLWTCEWGNTGMIQVVDTEYEPGMICSVLEPVGGDALFGMTYSAATNRVTGIMNYDLFVDLPNFTEWDLNEADVPDMEDRFDENWDPNFDWHKLDLSDDLDASDKGFGTGEADDGSIVDVVLCGITDIGSTGPVELERDYLGGRGASGSYEPDTTMVLLDNVGRLWYMDELTDMTKSGNTYTDDDGNTVSGTTGIHAWEYPDGTCSVFVIREIVETPLTAMYWQDTMPRYTYEFSDIYYAGENKEGNEVYLLSLYDYHNSGTTNQLYLLIMDEEGTLIELGDTGDDNVIATIYDANVDMDSLPSAPAASAAYTGYDSDAEDWDDTDGDVRLAVGPYTR